MQVWICVVLLCILLLLLFLVNMSWRIYGQSITSPPKSQGLSHSACASSLPPRLYCQRTTPSATCRAEKKNVTPTSAAVRKVLSKVD